MDRLAASPGIDHSRDAEIVAIFTRQIYELEAQLPLAIDRDEPLWEIDEALNQDAVARTRDQLSVAMGEAFTPTDLDQAEEPDWKARASVHQKTYQDQGK